MSSQQDMLDWSPDYCLSCDRQIHQSGTGAYCSQACRLADIERASASSGASSPSYYHAGSSSPRVPVTYSSGTGFYLPPALNFSAMVVSTQSSPATSPTMRSPLSSQLPSSLPTSIHRTPAPATYSARTPQPSYYSSQPSTYYSAAATRSNRESQHLSPAVMNDLRDYASSFDRSRNYKQQRRMTLI